LTNFLIDLMKIATWNLWNKNPDQFASVEFLIGLGAEVICLQEVLLETVFQIQKFCQSEKDKNLAETGSTNFSNEENSKQGSEEVSKESLKGNSEKKEIFLEKNLEKNNENQELQNEKVEKWKNINSEDQILCNYNQIKSADFFGKTEKLETGKSEISNTFGQIQRSKESESSDCASLS
jgi:hypothetical protein